MENRPHEVRAVFANFFNVARYQSTVRVTFGEGIGEPTSVLWREAVAMCIEDAAVLRDLLSQAIENKLGEVRTDPAGRSSAAGD